MDVHTSMAYVCFLIIREWLSSCLWFVLYFATGDGYLQSFLTIVFSFFFFSEFWFYWKSWWQSFFFSKTFLLVIFFIYISNDISKVPYTFPLACTLTHPFPSWPWHSPVLGHIIFARPRATIVFSRSSFGCNSFSECLLFLWLWVSSYKGANSCYACLPILCHPALLCYLLEVLTMVWWNSSWIIFLFLNKRKKKRTHA